MLFLMSNQQCWSTEGNNLMIMHMPFIFYTYTTIYGLFPGLTGWAAARRNLRVAFMVQWKITEADTLTIRLGTTPSGLISDPPPSSPPFFTPDALPGITLPIFSGLGQAPNMLACIPSGLVQWFNDNAYAIYLLQAIGHCWSNRCHIFPRVV